MRYLRPLSSFFACLAAVLGASPAAAHPVTVDGSGAEWFAREANADNLGLIARNASSQGEYVWRDVAADTRTDLASPETVGDLTRFRVTGDATGLSFLVLLTDGAATTATNPVQVQIAIDNNQVSGSGQLNFAGFADTLVAPTAAWEFLLQTQFRAGNQARLLDQGFAAVGAPLAVGVGTGTNTTLEITVPWARLGLSGPPATPLRFTVATFREQSNGDTVAVGDSALPNALDVVSDYNAPRSAAPYANTFQEFTTSGDQTVNYSADVWFGPTGEPYAPLSVVRYVSGYTDPTTGTDWIAVRNMTPAPLSLGGFRVTDAQTTASSEGAVSLPATTTLGAGSVFVLASNGALYTTRYGEAPDGEWNADDAATPDLAPYALWSSGTINLANSGDEILVLDRSHTAVDIVVYSSTYAGIVSMPAPATGAAASRNQTTFADTDVCTADFTTSTALCADDSTCGACGLCTLNVCAPRAGGTVCRASAGVCDPAETCDGTATACPADTLAPATVVCRASAGDCDVAEACTGLTTACPSDLLATSDVICRASAGPCDVVESCTGSSIACPVDGFRASSVVCRGSAGDCDPIERCTGNAAACPGDAFAPSSVVCRVSAGACDPSESCTGSGGACPADLLVASGTVCRASAGPCDLAESCTGANGLCPADAFAGPTAVCRASAGPCDLAESCTGVSVACPADALATSTTVCRPATGACDLADTCDGASSSCPADHFASAGASCADSIRCNGAETCNGSGACGAGMPVTCAASGNPCATNACSESTGGCALTNALVGTACADGNSCNGDETCNGSGTCQMGTAPADGGALCADASTDASAVDASDVADVANADDVVDAGDDVTTADATESDAAGADVIDASQGDVGGADAGRDAATADVRDASGSTDAPLPTGDDGVFNVTPTSNAGCGCRTSGAAGSGRGALGVLLALGATLTARRRRRR